MYLKLLTKLMKQKFSNFLKVALISFFLLIKSPFLLAFNFSGQWRYGQASETESSLNQVYSLSFYSTATQAIGFGSTIRYTRTDQGSRTDELIIPTAYFLLQNDFFNLNLSATDTERRSSDQPNISSYSFDTNLNTSLFKKRTRLRLYYGRATQHDDVLPHRIDTVSNQWGLNLNQRLYKFLIFYNYRGGKSEDNVFQSETKSQNHFLKAQYFDKWKRLSWNLGQQLVYGKTDWHGKIQTGGYSLYGTTLDGEWSPSKPNNGDDFNEYISKVQSGDPKNVGITLDVGDNPVDRIEFYYDTSASPLYSPYWKAIPTEIKWDIYWSDDKSSWTQIADDVSLPYEFSSTFSKGRYLKLIPRTTVSYELKVYDPKFRIYRKVYTTSYTQEISTYRTNVSLVYTFNPNAFISTFLTYDKTSSDSDFDIERITYGGSGYWRISRYFQPRINISKNTRSQSNRPDTSLQNFSLTILSELLDTLSFSTGYIYSLSLENSTEQTRINTFNFVSTAKLYPDLSLRWDLVYTNTYNYESDQTSNSFSSLINLIARLKPGLTLNTISSYNYSKTSTSSANNYGILLNISWRISQPLFIRAAENIVWLDNGDTNINSSYSIWLALTREIQFNLQYSFIRNDFHSDNLSGFFSWRISRYLSFRSNYSLTKTEDSTQWSCYFELMATF